VDDLTDDDLVARYRDGDADAFDALFDRHHAAAFRFANAMLGDRPAAEDVMQETFLAVARTARSYQPRGRFRTWLMQIVRNRCLNRLEQARARRAAFEQAGLRAEPPAHRPSPADCAQRNEQMDRVRAALAELPDRQREALALYAFEQLTYQEIAAVLGAPLNTVKVLIHRARAGIAAAVEEPRSRQGAAR